MKTGQIFVLMAIGLIAVLAFLAYRTSHPQLINECNVNADCGPGKVCKQPIAAMSMMAVADEHEGLGKWCVPQEKCASTPDCVDNPQFLGCVPSTCISNGVPCDYDYYCDTSACINDDDCGDIEFGGQREKCIMTGNYPRCAFPEDPAERTKCENLGGRYTQVCLERSWMCLIRAADAGKTCTDGSQCQLNRCVTTTLDLSDKIAVGTPMSGECAMINNPCGCFGRVEDGKYAGWVCVD